MSKSSKKAKLEPGTRGAGAVSRRSDGHGVADSDLQIIDRKVKEYDDASKDARNKIKLSDTDLDECVTQVMRYMLAANNKKPNVPVAYSILQQQLKELQKGKSGIAAAVIKHAQARFTKFGFEMVTVPGSKASYVLRSLLPGSFLTKFIYSDQEKARAALQMLVLQYLHTQADSVSEDHLMAYLSKFGYPVDAAAQHAQEDDLQALFGVADPLHTLVEQKIIATEMVANGGESVKHYKRGEAFTGSAAELNTDQMSAHMKALLEADC